MDISTISSWLLIFLLALFFLLVAIAGGKELIVLKIKLGPLGRPARFFAGVIGFILIIFGAFMYLKHEKTKTVSISGIVVLSTFERLPNSNYDIKILPVSKFAKILVTVFGYGKHITDVEESFGTFSFSSNDGIRAGTHKLILLMNKDEICEKKIPIEDGDEIIIERRTTEECSFIKNNPVDYFINKYKRGGWQDQLLSVGHLSRLVMKEEQILEYFKEEFLQSQIQSVQEMAAFVLGKACKAEAYPVLKNIIETDPSNYAQIRAAGFALCPGFPEDTEALKRLHEALVNPGETGERHAAAYFLFVIGKKTNFNCVLEGMIDGLEKSTFKDVRVENKKVLVEYVCKTTGIDASKWDVDTWRNWMNNDISLRDCSELVPHP